MEIIVFEELDSTNDYLKREYEKHGDFTIVRAVKQTNGRGRFERIWVSKNDLIFSILFKRELPHHFIAPLAINNALKYFGIESTIKWPNDILIDEFKVCGILIEKIFKSKQSVDIVGIGINIEQRNDFNYLNKYKKIDIDLLLNEIIKNYYYFSSVELIDLKRYYINQCAIIDKEVIFNNCNYRVTDINDNLELIICNSDSKLIVNANEINYQTMIISK